MFSDSLFDDFCDILQTGGKLFLLVVAKGDVVGDFAVIAYSVHGVLELKTGLFEFAFLIENAGLVDHDVWVLLIGLTEKGFGMLHFILLISNQRLKQDNLLL